jgi:ssDNA-binding Zn-finger/Zn-ribbon topoisomerase 1
MGRVKPSFFSKVMEIKYCPKCGKNKVSVLFKRIREWIYKCADCNEQFVLKR